MERLKIKRAVFYDNFVKLNNKSSTVINVEDIYAIYYEKPKLFKFGDFLLGLIFLSSVEPNPSMGCLDLHLNKKVDGKKNYLIRIKYEETLKLPETFSRLLIRS